MLHHLSSRLSVPRRVLLVAACAAPPVALLSFLFVQQATREYRFTAEELKGAAYIDQLWPEIVSGAGAPAPAGGQAQAFGAADEARAFFSSTAQTKAGRGAALIQAVADGSNLTLDTDLSSYYAMDAATVALPGLLAAVTPPAGPARDPMALGRGLALEQAALRDLEQVIDHDRTGKAAAALAGQPQRVRAAFDAFAANPQSPELRGQLVSAVDQAWRADSGQLKRLLEARQELTRERLLVNLGLVLLTLGAAGALAAALARALEAQLRALLEVMDRLNAGDTSVDIPYLGDRNETGRIAATLSAFRRGLVEAEAERHNAEEANAAVRESEARYRVLADNASDIIIHYDTEFRALYVSPSVAQLGHDPASLIGRTLLDYVHPDDRRLAKTRRQTVSAGGAVRPTTGRLQRGDGEWIWYESTLNPVHGEDGAVTGFVSTLRDISERREAEQALIESEARFRILADNMNDVLLRYDAEQRIDYVSPSVRQWGYTPEDFIGQKAGVFVHPEDGDRVAERRNAMLGGEPVQSVEARIRRADGSWTWIESNPAIIRGEDGSVAGVVLVLRDILKRKEAEAALMDSESRYRMLADNTSDIIQKFNADGLVEYMSPSVRQLGYEPEFFIGRPTAMLVDNEDKAEVVRRRQDLLSGKAVPPLESRVRASDGRLVWLESRPSPILDEAGKLLGVVNVMRDVSARKAAEAAMQELSLELRRVARASALGAFATSLAHEINQPLAAAAVSGEAALRWFSAEPPNYERGLLATRRMVDDVRRAADVVGGLRSLVTKDAARQDRFDAHEAVGEIVALTAGEFERSAVTAYTRLEAQDPWLRGDRVLFQQLMINLILNAVQAMRTVPGERLLFLRSRREGSMLVFEVEDRGPGIEADKRSQIFESMFTTKEGGTGLGLAISKSIVESHGGVISVEAAEPRGAVFKVRLPAHAKAQASADA